MPIKLGTHIFKHHTQAVKFIKRTKPYITKPDVYVASIERKQKKFAF